MGPVKKAEYLRLYKLAVQAVSDESLLPARTDTEITDLISREGWLCIREKGESKKDSSNSLKPNIWIRKIDPPGIEIGLYFNTIKAMRNAKELLQLHNSAQKERLVDLMHCLDDVYKIRLQRKTKLKHYYEKPKYENVLVLTSNEIDNEKIINLFEKSQELEKEGKEKRVSKNVSQEYPSLDLVYVCLKNDDAEFSKRIKEVFLCSLILYTSSKQCIKSTNLSF